MRNGHVPSGPGVSVWAELERRAARGEGVVLTPEQIAQLVADNARLVEAKNEAVRQLWGAAQPQGGG
jgi:hypothetical protein